MPGVSAYLLECELQKAGCPIVRKYTSGGNWDLPGGYFYNHDKGVLYGPNAKPVLKGIRGSAETIASIIAERIKVNA